MNSKIRQAAKKDNDRLLALYKVMMQRQQMELQLEAIGWSDAGLGRSRRQYIRRDPDGRWTVTE